MFLYLVNILLKVLPFAVKDSLFFVLVGKHRFMDYLAGQRDLDRWELLLKGLVLRPARI